VRTLAYLMPILVVAPICTAVAQDQMPALEPGARVRVTAPSLRFGELTATFKGWRGDTLILVAHVTSTAPVKP
jgi:hypothetical protein